jgi:hypothetical protein
MLTYLVAISYMSVQPATHIREDLTEKCSALLLGYRRNCAAATRQSQVRSDVLHNRASLHFDDLVDSPGSIPGSTFVYSGSYKV